MKAEKITGRIVQKTGIRWCLKIIETCYADGDRSSSVIFRALPNPVWVTVVLGMYEAGEGGTLPRLPERPAGKYDLAILKFSDFKKGLNGLSGRFLRSSMTQSPDHSITKFFMVSSGFPSWQSLGGDPAPSVMSALTSPQPRRTHTRSRRAILG